MAATADSRVSIHSIESAVSALIKYKAAQSSTQKLQLLPGDDYIYLYLTLKKLPSNPRTNPFKIPLPNPILDANSQLCLIIDDRPKTTTPPSDQIKKLIASQNITISKVIKISKLKTNYKPFEAKRKLCDSYDMFLVDKRVVHLLPKLIGKQFFKKKKLPLGVDLGKKNLKLQVEKALGSALMYVRTGTCSVMKVGKMEMEKDEIVDNVFDAIKGAVERVPKNWDGVRSLHLKFCDSLALPIYQTMPDVKLKIEGLKDGKLKSVESKGREAGTEAAISSDNDGGTKEISGFKDGKIGKKKKGRFHEVRYMDVEEDVGSDDDDLHENEQLVVENEDECVEQKGMEENLMDKSDDDDDDEGDVDETEKEELSIDESVGKKRIKSKASKEGVLSSLNGKKRAKKMDAGKKPKNDGLSSRDEADMQGKKRGKSEMNVSKKLKKSGLSSAADLEGKKKSEKIAKREKRVSAK